MTNTLNNSIVNGKSLSKSETKGHSTMRYLAAIPFAFLLQTAVGTAQAAHSVSTNVAEWWREASGTMLYVAPDEATIPNTTQGNRIRYGKRILEETYKSLGPNSGLPGGSYVTSQLSCTNCHIESGRAAYGQPWEAIFFKYGITNADGNIGQFSGRSNRYLDMKNRIHDCTIRSMNGRQLPDDSEELLSMIAYMEWLSTGIKVFDANGVGDWNRLALHGAGNVAVSAPVDAAGKQRAADPVRGKTVYQDNCAACHGDTGEGVWDATAQKYIYPAVWGQYSFNDGAGMYRLRTAVGFVKGNMPYGWANASDTTHMLSNADSWDAMAYVVSNSRPQFSGSLQDWWWQTYRPADCMPNWLLKAVDAGYPYNYPRINPSNGKLSGNVAYPEKWTTTQSKYGPWGSTTAVGTMLFEQKALQDAYLAMTPRPVFPNCVPVEF